MFFPNNLDEDWYWPVEILYTLAFFTLFVIAEDILTLIL